MLTHAHSGLGRKVREQQQLEADQEPAQKVGNLDVIVVNEHAVQPPQRARNEVGDDD